VLAHEAVVDAVWRDQIVPLLHSKFRAVHAADLVNARAYAYGGAVIQDLGYYPFGSHLFSNLVHYVRAGAFIETMLREANDVNEYAFALGALAHYASDTMGHSIGVNHAVPVMYPELGAKYGNEMIYADSPGRHLMVEFAFDVSQVAQGGYVADAYHRMIGFKVATSLLERAFKETYGLELRSLFGDMDSAIGTYRHAVSQIIPDMTLLAWRDKQRDVEQRTPGVAQRAFVFTMSSQEYERAYGPKYRKPGLLARTVVVLFKVLPKFGPFKPLAFKPLTPEAEALFLESFRAARARYGQELRAERRGRLRLDEEDLDTGRLSAHGNNPLAEKTVVDLLARLNQEPDAPPRALARILVEHDRQRPEGVRDAKHLAKYDRKAAAELATLESREQSTPLVTR
jgi:hypothetical protein